MRISRFLFCYLTGLALAAAAGAQAPIAAHQRQLSMTAGAFASAFRPDYATSYPLFGPGAYVDVHFTHWVQLEAEGRWLRFNDYYGQTQDNYLIGPRVPIKNFFHGYQLYGKALIGLGKMQFPLGDTYGHGSFTALAFGGTVEHNMGRKLSLRVIDLEYQDWPKWVYNKSLQPYGVSVGMGYRIF